MLRALITVVLLVVPSFAAEQPKVKPAAAKSDRASAPDYQPSQIDQEAEQQLLEMANQARAQAGVPPLEFDDGLMNAARAHAQVMARERQLSHQFDGESSLPRRLSAASPLHLDRAGENVATDATVSGAHQHLMLSPPHRENLLDSSYNVAGFGVIREGDQIYVVQDFGHSLPAYTTAQTGDAIADAVNRARRGSHQAALTRRSDGALEEAVCSMAREDRLATRSMHELAQHSTVLSYTNMHPEVLPEGASRMIENRGVKNFAVGVCYARTDTYPSGVYWVGLLFY